MGLMGDTNDRARQQTARAWLDTILREGVNLTPWEEDFVESVEVQAESGRTLSDKQIETIESIYTKRTP